MSIENPYSDVPKSYFTNQAFEHDQGSRSTTDADLKEKFPGQSLQPGAPDSAQHNGAPARSQPALVANPYGSVYRSPTAGGSKQAGVAEEESRPCPCCKRCKRCCCPGCVIS